MINNSSSFSDDDSCSQTDDEDSSLRILVVDDDALIGKISKKILEHDGYVADIVDNAAAGLQALQSRHYDLLITDNGMPQMSGLEMIKALRAQQVEVPIIMASGNLSKEDLNPELRINACLLKPYTKAQLAETVNEVLLTSMS
ncbi:MAG: response regulator [Chthoniobacterales bacterium]